MPWPFVFNGETFTKADFQSPNYVDKFPRFMRGVSATAAKPPYTQVTTASIPTTSIGGVRTLSVVSSANFTVGDAVGVYSQSTKQRFSGTITAISSSTQITVTTLVPFNTITASDLILFRQPQSLTASPPTVPLTNYAINYREVCEDFIGDFWTMPGGTYGTGAWGEPVSGKTICTYPHSPANLPNVNFFGPPDSVFRSSTKLYPFPTTGVADIVLSDHQPYCKAGIASLALCKATEVETRVVALEGFTSPSCYLIIGFQAMPLYGPEPEGWPHGLIKGNLDGFQLFFRLTNLGSHYKLEYRTVRTVDAVTTAGVWTHVSSKIESLTNLDLTVKISRRIESAQHMFNYELEVPNAIISVLSTGATPVSAWHPNFVSFCSVQGVFGATQSVSIDYFRASERGQTGGVGGGSSGF